MKFGDLFAAIAGVFLLACIGFLVHSYLTTKPCSERLCPNGSRPMFLDTSCICAVEAE